jgi:F0F1-type ATP synthase assembly protein I
LDQEGAKHISPGAGNGGGREPGQNDPARIGIEIRRALTGLLLAAALLAVSPVAAYSSLLGSLAVFIPAMFFAATVATKIGADSAVFLRAAVLGEVTKLALTALICMAVFLFVKPLAAGWFFAGMALTILAAAVTRASRVDK